MLGCVRVGYVPTEGVRNIAVIQYIACHVGNRSKGAEQAVFGVGKPE